jgi:hypothetical protein
VGRQAEARYDKAKMRSSAPGRFHAVQAFDEKRHPRLMGGFAFCTTKDMYIGILQCTESWGCFS